MREQFLNHIDRFALCRREDPVLLAVSGGVDSMAMLHLFIAAGFTVGVAHCNFQLRGKDSEGDEDFVVQTCKTLKVPVFVHRFETDAYAWENGLSTQMAARELRYAWFEELLEIHHYTALATGHHFDDSMETILLNITRGAATDGMAGIPVRNGRVIRPLLFATRAQVEKYAVEHHVKWREDKSNLTDDYQRNFIRHKIIPQLKELNPSLETTWQNGIEKIQGELAILHTAFDAWCAKNITGTPDKIAIDKKGLNLGAQVNALLWRFIKTYGFNYEQTREIIHALNGQPGKKFLAPAFLLVVDRENIFITPRRQDWNEQHIATAAGRHTLGPWQLSLESTPPAVRGNDPREAVLDATHLQFPLLWRKWRPGDFFHPLGMEHKKKLSDFFIDKKLSVADKEAITVLVSAGQIIWVAGHRIDDRFKVTPQTQHALRFVLTDHAERPST
jgi:tRNA(Ile)-lysidine synthase